MVDTVPISVIMSAYNCEKYIEEAIDSIINQTFADFEFIIVDDGSTDQTGEIVRAFSERDSRIRLCVNQENIGMPASLNIAIRLARGNYIARMDADDISLPDRFFKQIKFLESHPGIDVLGGNDIKVDNSGCPTGGLSGFVLSHSELVWNNLFGTFISHPTVMIRAEKYKKVGGYTPQLRRVQDVDLWIRLTKIGARFTNLPDSLLKNRVSPEQKERWVSNVQKSSELRRLFIGELTGEPVSPDAFKFLRLGRWPNPEISLDDKQLVSTLTLLFKTFTAMKDRGYFIDHELPIVYSDLLEKVTGISHHSHTFPLNIMFANLAKLSSHDLAEYYWLNSSLPRPVRWIGFCIMEPAKAIKRITRKNAHRIR